MENLLSLTSGAHLVSLNAYPSPKINARHGTDQDDLLQGETLPGGAVINMLATVFKLASMMEFGFLISDKPHTFLVSEYFVYSEQMCSGSQYVFKNAIRHGQVSLLWRGRGSRVMSFHFSIQIWRMSLLTGRN